MLSVDFSCMQNKRHGNADPLLRGWQSSGSKASYIFIRHFFLLRIFFFDCFRKTELATTMRISLIAFFGIIAEVAAGVELTKDSFDYYTEGKMALIKFSAPE